MHVKIYCRCQWLLDGSPPRNRKKGNDELKRVGAHCWGLRPVETRPTRLRFRQSRRGLFLRLFPSSLLTPLRRGTTPEPDRRPPPCCPDCRRRWAFFAGRSGNLAASTPPPPLCWLHLRKRPTGSSWRRCCSSASPSSSPRSTLLSTPSKNSRTADPLIQFALPLYDLASLCLFGFAWLWFVSLFRFRWRQQYRRQYPEEVLGKADARWCPSLSLVSLVS